MGGSAIPPSIPLEVVDDTELEAIEAALALATSASKRLKTSPPEATRTEYNADSAGRSLPAWAIHATRDEAKPNPSDYSRDAADSLSISKDHRFTEYNELEGQRFESQQLSASSLSDSTEAQSSNSNSWSFARPPCRAPPKPVVPKINFGGRIVYSRTWSEVEKATLELLQIVESKKANVTGRVPLGLDLEWRPFFNRVGEIQRKVALLQICADKDRCDVMHIIHSGIPPLLQSLLEDGSSVKVGVGIGGDASRMLIDYNVRVQGIEDLSSIANHKLGECPRRWSLSALCKKLTCKEVDKPRNIRLGNWEVNPLSTPQLQYAATDAFASWYLYVVLKSLPDPSIEPKGEEENP